MFKKIVFHQNGNFTPTLVFDIDATLVAAFDDKKYMLQHVVPEFFEDKNLLLQIPLKEELYPHCIHPATPVLMKALFDLPTLNIAFFSSAVSERNIYFVEKLLELSLGRDNAERLKAEKKVKILSKNDLTGYDTPFKKDLLKVVDNNPEALKHLIMIEDDPSYSKKEQTDNFLIVPSLEPYHYFKSKDEYRIERAETWVRYNNIFYMMGAIVYLFNQINESITLVEALTLFKKSVQDIELANNFYKRTEIERQFYEDGLRYLQHYDNRLRFFEPQEMINYKAKASDKKRTVSQISEALFFPLKEVAAHSAKFSEEEGESSCKKRKLTS